MLCMLGASVLSCMCGLLKTSGSFGVVCKATLVDDQPVAIKMARRKLIKDQCAECIGSMCDMLPMMYTLLFLHIKQT